MEACTDAHLFAHLHGEHEAARLSHVLFQLLLLLFQCLHLCLHNHRRKDERNVTPCAPAAAGSSAPAPPPLFTCSVAPPSLL
eukprot:scaffold61617_cov20-Tisochrysis_lutea.AAC.3